MFLPDFSSMMQQTHTSICSDRSLNELDYSPSNLGSLSSSAESFVSQADSYESHQRVRPCLQSVAARQDCQWVLSKSSHHGNCEELFIIYRYHKHRNHWIIFKWNYQNVEPHSVEEEPESGSSSSLAINLLHKGIRRRTMKSS
jgi:hypothetical protein